MSLYSCFNRLFHRNQGYQPVGIEETDELVGVQIDSAHLNKTTTQEIAKTILADYPSDPPAPPGTYTAWDFFKRQVIVLTQFTERAIVDALAMMIHSAEPEGGKGSIIPDKKTIEDLALVAGNGKPSVAYAMDRTKTLAGRLFLALRLTRPTDNLVTLKNRQALIQALKPLLQKGVTVLIKGSRRAKMEKVVSALVD